jgi:ATP phosphoribosyltransferase regulatory subunit
LPATGFAFNLLGLLHGLEKTATGVAKAKPAVLIFNRLEDRSDALELAACLRRQGCAVTRDIIRREFDLSLEYARRMAIGFIIVIGAPHVLPGELEVVSVADGAVRTVAMVEMLQPGSAACFAGQRQSAF